MSKADEGANPSASETNPFDIELVKQLVGLMSDNELSEVAIQWRSSRIRLRRGPLNSVQAAPQMYAAAQPSLVAGGAGANTTGATEDAKVQATASNLIAIDSPTVGTFYRSASPEAAPFVKVGSRISADTVVCLIEAMKVYNDIPAGVSGIIEEVLVENSASVEFGQPLFRVRPG